MMRNPIITFLVSLSLVTGPAWAQSGSSGYALSKELISNAKGNEFISGDYPGAVMMKVNLWGAVQKPGIHYVPTKTDLVTILSFAGGPTERANLDDVSIKRSIAGKTSVIPIDVEELMLSTRDLSPVLEANDIVVVPARSQMFSDNQIQAVTVLATVISVTLGIFLLKSELQK